MPDRKLNLIQISHNAYVNLAVAVSWRLNVKLKFHDHDREYEAIRLDERTFIVFEGDNLTVDDFKGAL